MDRRRLIVIVVLALVTVAGTAYLSLTVSADTARVEIDADHPLVDNGAVSTYQSDGAVSRNLSRLALELTIADTHDQADISGAHVDAGRTYLCLDYREGLSRTVRVYLPSGYFEPRTADLDPIGDGPPARLSPVRNGTMTAVTVTFTERRRACYALSPLTGIQSGAQRWIADTIGNVTGIDLPTLQPSGDGGWTHVNASAFGTNDTIVLPSGATVQFDRDQTETSTAWVEVPGCDDPSEQPVCQYAPPQDNTTIVMSTQPTPPDIRYRTSPSGPLSGLDSIVTDATRAIDDAIDSLLDGLGGLL